MNSPLALAGSFADFLLRRSLKHLIVHVTNHCNFRCEHCFVDFGTNKKDLELETYQALARETPPLFWLDIGGGEPFIRKDLADIVRGFQTRLVHVPSNGSLIPQMMEQLRRMRSDRPEVEVLIGLSLDGLEETHDSLRGHPGNYRQVWEAFESIRRFDPAISIKITTVITNKSIADVLPLMRVVKERGADFHSVILMRGDGPQPDTHLPPLDELRRLGPEIFQILSEYSYGRSAFAAHILRNYHRFLWNVSLDTLERQTQVIPCYAGQSHMVVMGDGGVSACEMLPSVGNLREQGFQDILHGPAYREQLRSIKNKECHCTHNCALLTSILFNPANFPQLVHQRVKA